MDWLNKHTERRGLNTLMQGSEQGCTKAFTLSQGPLNTLCKSSASSVPTLAYNLGAWPCRQHLKPGRFADRDLPWRRKAVYWSSISQTFLEQLKQHKHFADMSCVSTSGPGQAPRGSAEGLGHTGSREVSPWPSSRLPPQVMPQLWDSGMLLQSPRILNLHSALRLPCTE